MEVSNGIQIINISNPATPTLAGTYNTSFYAWDVQVVGNYAYIANRDAGLQIINISNPANPTLVGSYDTPGLALRVQVVGNYAYVADDSAGLQIINISNPTTPTLVGNYNTSGIAIDVQVVGDYAYVADAGSGLQIINISNPATPTLVDSYDTPGSAQGVQVLGKYAYVADESSGLQIIDVNEAPVITSAATATFTENSTATVYTVTATDINAGTTLTYSLSGTDANLFNINNGVVTFKTAPNFEIPSDNGANNVYDINVIASDGTLNTTKAVAITVGNINETPTDLTLSSTTNQPITIAENQIIGTVVGNLSSTDPDQGNTFTYSLVTGTGATDNSVFTISNNQLKTNSVFDYETKNSYNIRVRTTDQDGLSYEKELTIGVNDLNEITGNPLINNGRTPIVGTAGSDWITGGPGAKTITGGAGNDFFVFTDLRDVGQRITDFTVGEDKIVLTQLLSNINYNGTDPIADQYMRFVAGTGSNIGSTFLQIDRDGISGSAIFKNFLQVDNITTTQLNNVNNFVF
ncbi:MAG: hypothetical protein HEQ25_12725 [Dolichospermum sp. DET73]|nr:hypothetical protein [Dolichospermum sp. DET73]